MLGVVKLEPLPNNVPPVDASYQSIVVPAGLVAEMVTVPVPHLVPFTGEVGAVGKEFHRLPTEIHSNNLIMSV